jgi:hypothetical protein
MPSLPCSFWVNAGLAEEANVLLRRLVNDYPVFFVIVKVALVALGTALLWRFRNRRFAVIGIFLVFLVYYYILLYHLNYLHLVARLLV